MNLVKCNWEWIISLTFLRILYYAAIVGSLPLPQLDRHHRTTMMQTRNINQSYLLVGAYHIFVGIVLKSMTKWMSVTFEMTDHNLWNTDTPFGSCVYVSNMCLYQILHATLMTHMSDSNTERHNINKVI